jgi:hypothetical protein
LSSGVARVGRRHFPDARRVADWIDGCEVTWIACAKPKEAHDLETAMKHEKKPPLTRR